MKQEEILVIDDNQMTRDVLKQLLDDENYIVSSCPNGMSAIELIKEKPFEIFIIDYSMPEMPGDAVTAEVRKLCPDAFIIGFSFEHKELIFLAAGADKFIIKDELHAKLINAIKERNKEDITMNTF